jgi:hypothetical protein
LDKNGDLCRIGFLMGQEKLLEDSALTQPPELEAAILHPKETTDAFEDLLKNKVFQVNISLIEKMTKLRFSKAKDKITDNRRIELTMKETDLNVPESFKLIQKSVEGAPILVNEVANMELEGLVF